MSLLAPLPYFGGKRAVADTIWSRLGRPKHYIEPFCGSAAILLAAPRPASLEVVNDVNGFIANFWRTVKNQPEEVARWADYPVSHVDLGARHKWLMGQRDRLGEELQDPDWQGDPKVSGWWLWGQCSWMGSGWCEWGQVPHAGSAGMGVQAVGQVPHASCAGMFDTSAGAAAAAWLRKLSNRLERVRVTHGDWNRCLNNHYGGDDTAIFLDPPYKSFEQAYGSTRVADEVETWARDNARLRVALCGHVGDYELEGWEVVKWKRPRLTYAGSKTTDREAIWFSPTCIDLTKQGRLAFEEVA